MADFPTLEASAGLSVGFEVGVRGNKGSVVLVLVLVSPAVPIGVGELQLGLPGQRQLLLNLDGERAPIRRRVSVEAQLEVFPTVALGETVNAEPNECHQAFLFGSILASMQTFLLLLACFNELKDPSGVARQRIHLFNQFINTYLIWHAVLLQLFPHSRKVVVSPFLADTALV